MHDLHRLKSTNSLNNLFQGKSNIFKQLFVTEWIFLIGREQYLCPGLEYPYYPNGYYEILHPQFDRLLVSASLSGPVAPTIPLFNYL